MDQSLLRYWKILILLGLHSCVVSCQKESKNSKTTEWLQYIVPQNYVSFSSPCDQLYDGNFSYPTVVNFRFTPESLMSVEPKTMDFSVDFQIMITWEDERLDLPEHVLRSNTFEFDIPRETASKLWAPYIILKNCKRCKHELIDSSEQRMRLSIFKEIIVKVARTYTFTCEIDLKNYPFDRQNCQIIIEKYEMINEAPFETFYFTFFKIDPKSMNSPPEFVLASVKVVNCTNTSIPYEECMKYVFHLRRQYTHHIMLVFIPSMLIVVLSWISFWLDPDVAAPRVALGLTSLLTLATQFNNAQKDLPPVATVKALDIWMFTCMIMVFSSLVEFAISNQWSRRRCHAKVEPKVIRVRQFRKSNGTQKGFLRRRFRKNNSGCQNNNPQKRDSQQLTPGYNPTCIDILARISFPAAFISFNIFYWLYYISEHRY